MTEFAIRLAQMDDAEAMTRIEDDAAALFADEPSLAEIAMPPSNSPQTYREMIGKRHCLVAASADDIIGFAACKPYGRELHLHELSVASAHQARGVGARLLAAVAIDAHNSGFSAITLNTFIDLPWNAPFYARHGFVEVEDLESHPRLAKALEEAAEAGLPRERRCAMIRFLV